jgi:hypothetical protein
MITVPICFAALAVVRDAETNSVSAFNILEGIVPSGLPVFLAQAALFILWEREPDDPRQSQGTFTVRINQQELLTSRQGIDFGEPPLRRTRTVVRMNGLVVPAPGELTFSFRLDDGAEARYSIEVTQPRPVVGNPAGDVVA